MFGSLAPYPTALDDPSHVEVRWAEFTTTRSQLVATIKLTKAYAVADRAHTVRSYRPGAAPCLA